MNKNLTLTGMMGVGKSTIGKAISKELSMQFIDIDKIIQRKLNLTVQKIFEMSVLTSISFVGSVFMLIFEIDFSREISFALVVFFCFSKFSFFHISTLSSERRGEKKINIIKEKKIFLFKFNNFIGNIFFNFLFWGWKIKFTK